MMMMSVEDLSKGAAGSMYCGEERVSPRGARSAI